MDVRICENKEERAVTVTLLLFRTGVFLFSVLLVIKTEGPLQYWKGILLLCFGIYQTLVACMFRPVMSIGSARLLFCSADLLITQTAIFLTGGITSPFIPCIFMPVFTLHFLYGKKGIALGVLSCLASAGAIFLVSKGTLPVAGNMDMDVSLAVIGISVILFYIIPYLALRKYFVNSSRLIRLEEKNDDLDDMNNKLMVLYEMTGRFNYENGIAQIMDRLLALCNELFRTDRICIFLIRNGEVEIYGNPAPEEKENIYQLIMEQKKGTHPEESKEYILQEGSLAIPLIRGSRIDGVLSLNGWDQHEITDKEAILFSLIANMICTYLENLEYVESLQLKHIPDTSVLLNHLDSGKAVKGILDKRILPT